MARRVTEVATREELLAALGPTRVPGAAVALLGGADRLDPEARQRFRAFFGAIAAHARRTGTAIVDGGTDSGVMALIGSARRAIGGGFRLVGVTPRGALTRLTSAGRPIRVARGHPEIILVPGSRFGDETDWLFAAADHLGAGAASTLVVNGGQLTSDEAQRRLAAGHRVIVVEGSGRAADELAANRDLRASGRLRVIPLSADEAGIAAVLEEDRTT